MGRILILTIGGNKEDECQRGPTGKLIYEVNAESSSCSGDSAEDFGPNCDPPWFLLVLNPAAVFHDSHATTA